LGNLCAYLLHPITCGSRLQNLRKQPDDSLQTQIDYYENHSQHMLYRSYDNQGLFYGSGVVEAGCKAVIGQRLKQSGMFWSEAGAQSVFTLRCLLLSNRWDLCRDRLNNSGYLPSQSAARPRHSACSSLISNPSTRDLFAPCADESPRARRQGNAPLLYLYLL